MDAAPAACTPITRQEGLSVLTAIATPLMSPPPPMGTTTCSTSGSCSRISRPMVPCPAITQGSLKGWAKVYPCSCVRRSASRAASSYTPGTSTTSAP